MAGVTITPMKPVRRLFALCDGSAFEDVVALVRSSSPPRYEEMRAKATRAKKRKGAAAKAKGKAKAKAKAKAAPKGKAQAKAAAKVKAKAAPKVPPKAPVKNNDVSAPEPTKLSAKTKRVHASEPDAPEPTKPAVKTKQSVKAKRVDAPETKEAHEKHEFSANLMYSTAYRRKMKELKQQDGEIDPVTVAQQARDAGRQANYDYQETGIVPSICAGIGVRKLKPKS
jgi:hypothetical protein